MSGKTTVSVDKSWRNRVPFGDTRIRLKNMKFSAKKKLTRSLVNILRKMYKDSPIIRAAEREFDILEKIEREEDPFTEDNGKNYDNMLKEAALDILAVFVSQNHSGMSASILTNSLLIPLFNYKPLSPLTGESHEWAESYAINGGNHQQNKRYSAVFRDNFDNETAYHMGAIVFKDKNGLTYTSSIHSNKKITFPYTPTIEVRDEPQNAD